MLFDLHMVGVLKTGLQLYGDSLPAFLQTFPDAPASEATKWHASLFASDVEVRSIYAPGAPEGYPLVFVASGGTTPDTRTVGKTFGDAQQGLIEREDAQIVVQADSDLQCRALCRCIQAIILRSTASFLAQGYSSVQMESVSPVDLDALAENFGLYQREIGASAKRDFVLPTALPDAPAIEDLEWAIQLGGVETDPDRDPAIGARAPEDDEGSVTPAAE